MKAPFYTVASVLCLLSVLEIGVLGLTCLYCDSVALPNLCRTITRCQSDEVCELVEYVTSIGAIRYRQKCVKTQACTSRKRSVIGMSGTEQDSDVVSCVTCCASDLCNAGGCSQIGFAPEENVCYSCETQIGSNTCDKIERCGRDQICRIIPSDIPGAPKNLYKTGCQHPRACAQALTLIGRKRTACNTCCNGTLCNDYDPDRSCSGATSMSSTTPFPTTVPGMTTLAATSVSGDCKDTSASCPKNFCILPAYKGWAKANCKKTCGFCTKTGGITTIRPPLACMDLVSGCSASLCTIGDYHSWAKQNCEKTCGYCTGHVAANTGDEWVLLLKAVAGVSRHSADIYSLWTGNHTMNSLVPASPDLTNTFMGHFKPDNSNHWDRMRFDKVKVSMYVNGTEKAFITFNTTGLDKVSWFKADRVINSTWGQQPKQGLFHMELSSKTGFEFSARSTPVGDTGCDVTGWMTVATNANCVSSKLHFSAFLFCPGPRMCRWGQDHFETAQVLAIHGHSAV